MWLAVLQLHLGCIHTRWLSAKGVLCGPDPAIQPVQLPALFNKYANVLKHAICANGMLDMLHYLNGYFTTTQPDNLQLLHCNPEEGYHPTSITNLLAQALTVSANKPVLIWTITRTLPHCFRPSHNPTPLPKGTLCPSQVTSTLCAGYMIPVISLYHHYYYWDTNVAPI